MKTTLLISATILFALLFTANTPPPKPQAISNPQHSNNAQPATNNSQHTNNAQPTTNNSQQTNNSQPTTNNSSDTLDYATMSDEQRRDLDSALHYWLREGHFQECAPSSRFKMNCYDCEAKLVHMTVHVAPDGQIDQYARLQAALRCRKHTPKVIQAAESCMIEAAKTLVLTKAFADQWVKLTLGWSLGC